MINYRNLCCVTLMYYLFSKTVFSYLSTDLLFSRMCSRVVSSSSLASCETIFALSTATRDKGSAIAVIRVSGVESRHALRQLTRTDANKWLERPRTAILSALYEPQTHELLDRSIVIWFAKPNSYTGEDMCEFHVHGSKAVTSAVLRALNAVNGCRAAQNGEFTKRALLNNKIDLIEAEGISDLICSQTDSQRRRALSAITGSVANVYDLWRTKIIESMAHLEANIDFSEDELIDDSILIAVKSNLSQLLSEIVNHLEKTKRKSDLIRDGLRVAIIGLSNAGKSTFINQFCERDLSIVSPISGTTRDIVETWININGYAISICDTAGIKDLSVPLHDPIETQGIKKAIERAKNSDVILYIIDATTIDSGCTRIDSITPNYIKQIIDSCNNVIFIFNKTDLLTKEMYMFLQNFCKLLSNDYHLISCLTLDGFEDFINNFTQVVENVCGNPKNENLFNSDRHEQHLLKVVQQIKLCLHSEQNDIAIGAHHLRQAVQHISYITGQITTEHILDMIFKDFCIGK